MLLFGICDRLLGELCLLVRDFAALVVWVWGHFLSVLAVFGLRWWLLDFWVLIVCGWWFWCWVCECFELCGFCFWCRFVL